ncbi:thiamine pyrophosphokinase [Amylibacter marinus]|uniref:Thiamine diphosphokinase n=1 Tax=Amylibacter marinus TaxID=1475483 RepID=A0ABQ5VT37_9RHOB|nr:thiamine diphosphokinase [Amylibacter marinus]GLQ34602.1 thiamine pyrophosphokinase [Amylibacter marinus]
MTRAAALPNLEFETPVVLLGGGDVCAKDCKFLTDFTGPILCADAGYHTAQKLGLDVACVLGDFDSVDQAEIQIPRLHLPDQNFTDFEKALRSITAPQILCFGFLGQRLDHTLASFSTLAKNAGTPAILISDQDLCFACPKQLNVSVPCGTRFSLFPLERCIARSAGLAYALNGLELSPMGIISTSNHTTEPQVRIDMVSGTALVVIERDVMGLLCAQLT